MSRGYEMPILNDCTERSSHALTCGQRMREPRPLPCSLVVDSDGLDTTAENGVSLVQLIERGV
jgi:hypothetical protein